MLGDLPWDEMLRPEQPLEMVVRGTLVYFGLLFLMRVILKRQVGSFASSDILLMLLISEAVENAMGGEYKSIPDGLILVTTLLVWDFVVDWMSFRFRWLDGILTPKPLPLIHNGKMIRKNMSKEFVTVAELKEKMREQGISRIEDVRDAYLESNGELSFIEAKP